jgi:hypothetical protein
VGAEVEAEVAVNVELTTTETEIEEMLGMGRVSEEFKEGFVFNSAQEFEEFQAEVVNTVEGNYNFDVFAKSKDAEACIGKLQELGADFKGPDPLDVLREIIQEMFFEKAP